MDSLTSYDKFTIAVLTIQAVAVGKLWLDTRTQNKKITALSSLVGRLYGFKDAVKRCHVRQCPFRAEVDAMTGPLPDPGAEH
jgi:hypothetical protein